MLADKFNKYSLTYILLLYISEGKSFSDFRGSFPRGPLKNRFSAALEVPSVATSFFILIASLSPFRGYFSLITLAISQRDNLSFNRGSLHRTQYFPISLSVV